MEVDQFKRVVRLRLFVYTYIKRVVRTTIRVCGIRCTGTDGMLWVRLNTFSTYLCNVHRCSILENVMQSVPTFITIPSSVIIRNESSTVFAFMNTVLRYFLSVFPTMVHTYRSLAHVQFDRCTLYISLTRIFTTLYYVGKCRKFGVNIYILKINSIRSRTQNIIKCPIVLVCVSVGGREEG